MALHSFCDNDPTDGEDPSMAPYVHTAILTTIKGFYYITNATLNILIKKKSSFAKLPLILLLQEKDKNLLMILQFEN